MTGSRSGSVREPFSVLSPDGTLDEDRLTLDLDEAFLEQLYREIQYARRVDRRAVKLQRQGQLGTYAPCEGQEACQVASVLATDPADPLFPTYRETAALLSRGVPLAKILQYWSGDERGSSWSRDRNVFPISIPVGSQGLHAVGAARALRYRDEPGRPVVYFGDGATSEGDLLEALNFAGVWEVPVLFFCQNNQWAISVPREEQTASETLAEKADAFGFEGHLVDGNDPLATYQLIRDLRSGDAADGPVFVEAVTYRYGDHTTSDDAGRYRDDEELEHWRRKDPVGRLRRLLEERLGWSEEDERTLLEELDGRIDESVAKFRELDEPDPDDLFEYTFESLPEPLRRQRDELREERRDD